MSAVEAKPQQSHLPAWMVLVGIVVGIVGLSVMGYASSKRKRAESIDAYTHAYGYVSDTAAHYVTLGHWGIGLLIAGGVVVLAGVTAMAVRSR